MVCQECNQLYHSGLLEHMRNLYNLLDFVVVSIYISIFTMKYWAMYKVKVLIFHTLSGLIYYYKNKTHGYSTHPGSPELNKKLCTEIVIYTNTAFTFFICCFCVQSLQKWGIDRGLYRIWLKTLKADI